jgi:hypothetical protein
MQIIDTIADDFLVAVDVWLRFGLPAGSCRFSSCTSIYRIDHLADANEAISTTQFDVVGDNVRCSPWR